MITQDSIIEDLRKIVKMASTSIEQYEAMNWVNPKVKSGEYIVFTNFGIYDTASFTLGKVYRVLNEESEDFCFAVEKSDNDKPYNFPPSTESYGIKWRYAEPSEIEATNPMLSKVDWTDDDIRNIVIEILNGDYIHTVNSSSDINSVIDTHLRLLKESKEEVKKPVFNVGETVKMKTGMGGIVVIGSLNGDGSTFWDTNTTRKQWHYLENIDRHVTPEEITFGEEVKNWVIKEDNICPATKEPCDDECCPVGAVCNLKSTTSNELKASDVGQPSGLTLKGVVKKYNTYLGNINWHIETNNPDEEIKKQLRDRSYIFEEIINDLRTLIGE